MDYLAFRKQQFAHIMEDKRDQYDETALHWYDEDKAYFRVITMGNSPFMLTTGLYLAQAGEVSRFTAVRGYDMLHMLDSMNNIFTNNNISIICAMLEPALLRILARYGVTFGNHLPPVNYLGERVPVWDTVYNVRKRFCYAIRRR